MRANLVGSSVVSAITHTPASGPFALVTVPPMSSGSMATGPPCVWTIEENAPANAHASSAARTRYFLLAVIGTPFGA